MFCGLCLLLLVTAHAFTIPPHRRFLTRLHDSNVLINELTRESGNIANFIGGAAQLFGNEALEVGKVVAPVVGKAIGATFDTVAPIVQVKTSEAMNFAAPIVQGKAKEAIDFATPVAQQTAADTAAFLVQEKDQAVTQTAIFFQNLKDGEVGKSFANSLREAASAIDRKGTINQPSTVPLPLGSPGSWLGPSKPPIRGLSLMSSMVNPLEAAMAKVEDEIHWVEIKVGAGFVGGLAVLAVLRKIAEPVERVARKVFFFAFIAGIGYVAVEYGPRAYQMYQFFHR